MRVGLCLEGWVSSNCLFGSVLPIQRDCFDGVSTLLCKIMTSWAWFFWPLEPAAVHLSFPARNFSRPKLRFVIFKMKAPWDSDCPTLEVLVQHETWWGADPDWSFCELFIYLICCSLKIHLRALFFPWSFSNFCDSVTVCDSEQHDILFFLSPLMIKIPKNRELGGDPVKSILIPHPGVRWYHLIAPHSKLNSRLCSSPTIFFSKLHRCSVNVTLSNGTRQMVF